VLLIGPEQHDDSIVVQGTTFDLGNPVRVRALLQRLHVRLEILPLIADTLQGMDRDSRNTLARLAIIWAEAEHRGPFPGRLIISGEHVGGGMFWGKRARGYLLISDIAALTAHFPRAANAIEDLITSACYSAVEVLKWPKIFPALKTIWAYSGTCPGAFTGAITHLSLWDRATRGPAKAIDRVVAKGTRKADHVVVWTPLGGLQSGDVSGLEELRARLAAGHDIFEAYFDGRATVTNTDDNPLRDYYDVVQSMLRHIDLPVGEKQALEARRDTTIRLIFYDSTIKGRFATAYGSELSAGYAALGLPRPDIAHLSRKGALEAVAQFERSADAKNVPAAEVLRPYLVEGLV